MQTEVAKVASETVQQSPLVAVSMSIAVGNVYNFLAALFGMCAIFPGHELASEQASMQASECILLSLPGLRGRASFNIDGSFRMRPHLCSEAWFLEIEPSVRVLSATCMDVA